MNYISIISEASSNKKYQCPIKIRFNIKIKIIYKSKIKFESKRPFFHFRDSISPQFPFDDKRLQTAIRLIRANGLSS